MKLLHLQPVSTIFVAISVAAKPANPVDGQVRSLREKEDATDAPFIGPLSAPHEVTRQLSHEPKRFENPPTRALQHKQTIWNSGLSPVVYHPPELAAHINSFPHRRVL